MANTNSISPASIKQIDIILSCIATNALTIKTLSSEALNSCGRNQELAAALDALGHVASSIGYMADVGLAKLGSSGCMDMESWHLPPALRSDENAQGNTLDDLRDNTIKAGVHHE